MIGSPLAGHLTHAPVVRNGPKKGETCDEFVAHRGQTELYRENTDTRAMVSGLILQCGLNPYDQYAMNSH